jgi:hypothetical protein
VAHILIAVDPGQSGAFVWSKTGDPEITADKMPPTDVEVAQYIADISLKAKDVELFLEEPSTAGYGPKIPAASIARLAAHSLGKKKDHGKGWKNHIKARALELYGSRLDITLWNADAVLIYDAAQRGAIN